MARRTFQYTYRSTCGLDVTVTQELRKGEDKSRAVTQVFRDFKDSCTPLVKVDGEKVDITKFLNQKYMEICSEVDRLESLKERLAKEIVRRQKEPA